MPSTLAAPNYGFNDAAVLVTSICEQATGQKVLTPTDLSDFISVGTTALSAGYDPLLNAISQVLSRTIYSIRPYDEKFKGLLSDTLKWGNHVRKLKLADDEFESDQRYIDTPAQTPIDFLADGDSVDMYSIKKPKALQLNFYGQNIFQQHVTLFRDQLDVAFRSPDELMGFTSMIMTNMSNRMAHARETMARAALANFIGGKNILGTGHVVHLVTEYNNAHNASLTTTTVKDAANWPGFCRWLAGFIMTLSDRFTEYSQIYQVTPTGYALNQHTPKERQRLYLLSNEMNSMITEVLSTTYNEKLARIGDYEAVNFWQGINDPDEIQVTPSYMDASGAIVTGAAQTMTNVLGVLLDEEAIMTTQINEWSAPTPMNAAGGYSNLYFHAGHRYANDFSEKGIVLLLDT